VQPDLTAARTAAGSALATKLCCRPHAKHIVVFGAGLQAECHLEAILLCVNTLERITIINRSLERANELAAKQSLPDDCTGIAGYYRNSTGLARSGCGCGVYEYHDTTV
jgi:ornithine cyclodeaminase/alanine dehydrogenase-like protein (mu-crystallin family)